MNNQPTKFRVRRNTETSNRNKTSYTGEHEIYVQRMGGAHEWQNISVIHLMYNSEVKAAAERHPYMQLFAELGRGSGKQVPRNARADFTEVQSCIRINYTIQKARPFDTDEIEACHVENMDYIIRRPQTTGT